MTGRENLVRVTSKGQVTIPRDLRNMFGILPDSEAVFGIEGGKITLAAQESVIRSADRERLESVMALRRDRQGE